MEEDKFKYTGFTLGDAFNKTEFSADNAKPSKEEPLPSRAVPQRYAIQEIGQERVLTCLEAPNLTVQVKAGLTFSSAAAKKSPPGTIFLDGAAQAEPFIDRERKIYNFDHHEGCVRPFTLSTCEQVLVMIMKGLDLRDREWKIYANEPDLDTVLAIWLIFNHLRISRKESLHMRLLNALVRLEGAIDSFGLELKEISGLPPELLKNTQRVIDFLRKKEIQLKKDGLWNEVDYLTYTASVLLKIDKIIYKNSNFNGFRGIRELARIDLTDDRIVAVVEADTGIYELEPQLNDLYGNRLGLVALRKGSNTYTPRRLDLFMPGDLETVYERLNYIDPAVKCRSVNNRWGGSDEIGGSPRKTGTGLLPRQIAKACRDALQKPSVQNQAVSLLKTGLIVFALIASAEMFRLALESDTWLRLDPISTLATYSNGAAMVLLILLTGVLLFIMAFGKAWQFGFSLPVGKDWWLLLPGVVLCGLLGGVWFPGAVRNQFNSIDNIITLAVLAPLAAELLFRSLAHGLLAREGPPIQHCNSSWFLSWPVAGSAFLYSAFIGYRLVQATGSTGSMFIGWNTGNIFGAFALGIIVGMVRERSQSILPAVLFHVVAIASVTVVAFITG